MATNKIIAISADNAVLATAITALNVAIAAQITARDPFSVNCQGGISVGVAVGPLYSAAVLIQTVG